MILTCPSCGTQYAVKDGAIPPGGRQVRCASCKHAWHQYPEETAQPSAEEPVEPAAAETQDAPGGAFDDMGAAAPQAAAAESVGFAPIDPVAPPGEAMVEATPASSVDGEWTPPAQQQPAQQAPVEPAAVQQAPTEPAAVEPAPAEPAPVQRAPVEPTPVERSRTQDDSRPQETGYEDDFSPFTMDLHDEPRRRSPLLTLLMTALLIAALAAAFWFLAPPEWKERVGIAAAGETPLQLMMTHSDRQTLASGNELLAVSGRVINPTDERQDVPPISAQLRSSSGKLVYSWTIAPPARTLPPGASATFNSAEVNVPSGGDELTITLGASKT